MEYLVKMEKISKSFGKVEALRNVDFYIKPGEVVGLIGDNGAGKSTLIKVLMGVYPPERGEIYFEGKKLENHSVSKARKLGIEVVYQENNLANLQSIWRNIFIGREKTQFLSFIDIEKSKRESTKLLREIGFKKDIDPDSPVQVLSGGERQGVAIARAMFYKSKLIILDEPTTALSIKEAEKTINYVREAKREGTSIIFLTHNFYHVYPIADKFVILYHGMKKAELPKKSTSIENLNDIIRGRT